MSSLLLAAVLHVAWAAGCFTGVNDNIAVFIKYKETTDIWLNLNASGVGWRSDVPFPGVGGF